MKTKGLVLAMLLIFGFASVAAAECAWVLWKRTSYFPPITNRVTEWKIQEAVPDHQHCLQRKTNTWTYFDAYYKEQRDHFRRIDRIPNESFTLHSKEKGRSMTDAWFCLPDTLDPRAQEQ